MLAAAFGLAMTLGAATPVYAAPLGGIWNIIQQVLGNKPKPGGTVRPRPAPEIDPNAARSAIALLTGGMLLLSHRRRRG